ncbi:E3 ubiquitin protein ligase DRIP2-like [Mercurialis annua]|uniref:E3 ubiquitin protein ligase DRIP2-like n=1 Tax=Mercurialis annua TaxID=3986 RepID=UPI00215DF2D6|nr:E3 ubiquitin protein ligase DRIP2-like [Mercurialis annua]
MAGQVVRVKREIIEACMTCPLCNKLLRDATTISLCLHTFCRKCIYEKLSDEEGDCCPVCNIDLGCLPVEKLRPDHNLQDIRAKIFPFKRRKIKAPEVMPSIALPPKRKERSLSSLVVSAPKAPMQTGFTGRRTKAGTRKVVPSRCNFSVEEFNKNEDSLEDHPMSSSSPGSPSRLVQNKMQDSSAGDSPNTPRPEDDPVVDRKIEGKADLWTPLNCLVEAANRSKSSKSNSQGPSHVKLELLNAPDDDLYLLGMKDIAESPHGHVSEVYRPRAKIKEHSEDSKAKDDSNGTKLHHASVKRRRLTARKRAAMSEELSASARLVLEAVEARNNRRNCPIWFTLVASEDQKGDASLPQISAGYLRIKDGKMPVSFIQKYLVKKLDLTSEAEVEIMCRGQSVLPTLQLQNLVDLWFRTASTTKKVPAPVGSSAKDFVMVLSYCRKVRPS